MALTLTPGSESRLDGAPGQALPSYADMVEQFAIYLVSQDSEGALYGGDPANARADAIRMVKQQEAAQQAKAQQRNAAGQQRVAQADADRDRMRASRQGMAPESLPMDEYGAVSGRTVQEANRPLAEAEAALAMEQTAADQIVRRLREGTPTFEAQGDLDFLRERGERNPMAGPGRTDMAMRGQIRERRGQYYEMPDGTRIPVGREPTAAEIRGERGWQDWTDETPGTERQALYNPQGYEQFREGARQDIRDRARENAVEYGTGTDRNPDLTADQLTKRAVRAESEERVRVGQRGRFYEERLRADAGLPTRPLGPNPSIEDLERAAYAQRYAKRQRSLESREQNRIDQAMLAGGQPTGGPGGTRAATNAINQLGPGWREIALLDRLTNGRVGGPTPLGVEQFQAGAIAQGVGRALTGVLSNMDPNQMAMAARLKEQERLDTIYADADAFVEDQFAWKADVTGASEFTIEEQQRTIQYLTGKYRIPLQEAQSIVDSIAAGRVAGGAAAPAMPMPGRIGPAESLPPAGR